MTDSWIDDDRLCCRRYRVLAKFHTNLAGFQAQLVSLVEVMKNCVAVAIRHHIGDFQIWILATVETVYKGCCRPVFKLFDRPPRQLFEIIA